MQPVASERERSWIALAVFRLLAATLASRLPFFDNSIIHKDDQFYLLVGQSLLQGDLLYVDIWDRKPAGLFLIYAGIATLGDGTIPYQLVACLIVLLTSLVIARIALRVSKPRGAILAGLTYILLLPALGGEGGQSPIFYNLLMAGAALLTLDAFDRERGSTEWRALSAMLLCGLAMTVKQTTMFEGMAFGLLHLWAMRRQSADWPKIAGRGARMVAVALAPTALIFLVYGLLGHLQELWQATVLSVFAKGSIPFSSVEGQVLRQAAVLAVPLLVAVGWLTMQARQRIDRRPLFFFFFFFRFMGNCGTDRLLFRPELLRSLCAPAGGAIERDDRRRPRPISTGTGAVCVDGRGPVLRILAASASIRGFRPGGPTHRRSGGEARRWLPLCLCRAGLSLSGDKCLPIEPLRLSGSP